MHVSSSKDFSSGVRVGKKKPQPVWSGRVWLLSPETPFLHSVLKACQGEHSAAPASCRGGTAELTGPS